MKYLKTVLSFALVFCLACSAFPIVRALEEEGAQSPVVVAPLPSLYADADEISGWAVEPVELAWQNGLMRGSNGCFYPKRTLTRAELAMIFYHMAGDPAIDYISALTDVAESQWYAAAVSYVRQNGLMDADQNRFRPDEPAKRQEVAAIIARLYELDTSKAVAAVSSGQLRIGDYASVSAAYKPYVAAVFYEGIMTGNGVNFRPNAAITREETAKVLYALLV